MRHPALTATVLSLILSAALGREAAAQNPPIGTSELFVFFSDPDVALHHFLHNWARHGDVPKGPVQVTEVSELDRLTQEERRSWLAAVEKYKAIAQRSLLFDRDMVLLRNVFAGLDDGSTSDLAKGMKPVLASVRGIYQTYWWPLHDERNRQWVEGVLPTLQASERVLASRIAEAYGAKWVERRIRVDVSPYVDEQGAYTTAEPHSTISSINSGYRMPFALEMIFHEASHGEATEAPLRRMINDAFAAAGKSPPRDLWHVTLFYTAGEVVRRSAGPKYRTFAENAGLYRTVPGWGKMRDLLDKHWKPVLDGKQNRLDAFRKLAREY